MKKPLGFVLTGIFAAIASAIVHAFILDKTGNATLSTWVRMFVVLPILHLGYRKWVLFEEKESYQSKFGVWKGEVVLVTHVLSAVGLSILVKLAGEPLLTNFLLSKAGFWYASLTPFLFDFIVGPLANWLVLTKLDVGKYISVRFTL